MAETPMSNGRLQRVAEFDRATVTFEIDGQPAQALAGDSVLVAVLTSRSSLRQAEFGGGERAGFCLMGACQDCWMWTADGSRLRACTTVVTEGLRVITTTAGMQLWPASE